jgi:hypothetical protein
MSWAHSTGVENKYIEYTSDNGKCPTKYLYSELTTATDLYGCENQCLLLREHSRTRRVVNTVFGSTRINK